MATHSSILAWRKEFDTLQSVGSQRVGQDCATRHTHLFQGTDLLRGPG